MRVVAGSAKGVRLAPVPKGVRPVSDRAREGLFSSLGERVRGARVLDLFAGTGALGVEALSRGAAEAVFVERDRAAIAVLRRNVDLTRVGDRAVVVGIDVRRFVTRDDKNGAPFDLVLADPPYDLGGPELDGVLADLAEGWLAAPSWTVALTRRKGSSTPVIPVHWAPARRLEYGDTLVLLLREA
ncbi:MAG TPA: 16S rRNA (guanine(966)-N(2))-methyltransferase RsmD [Actinomycetota bacterium]|nr:16S rRNA (guanine(966)-N(2))-methyltransferase RsmD [Actinomycetota bacterium]